MAPKKNKEEAPKRVVLGRSTNNLKIGIVGLPNVGKSSLFNILTKLAVPAENFPFCTVDPNVAKINVPDKRFNFLVESYKPASVVPAQLSVTDIAGLIKGAAEGEGLGNAFLSHIAAVDGIFHVCRAFDDKNISHVEESVDPVRDLNTIHNELRLKDLAACVKYIEANEKNVARKVGGKEAEFELNVMKKVREKLEAGLDIRARENSWTANEIEVLNKFMFLTAKPMIYLCNVSIKSYKAKGNKYLLKISEYVKEKGNDDLVIPFSVKFEEEVLDIEINEGQEAKKKFLAESKMRSMIPRIIRCGYEALDLIHFFTAGKDEVRAWSIRRGTLAPRAAGTIHTDFEKGFICADVMKFEDLKEAGGDEAKVKAQGKLSQKGRNYEFEDGVIAHFKFNN
eukprot:maker-scaffold_5-snap-gene-1.61-mRNA-1 protein AED:0.02 eAED:0.02 QI:50/1/1/1/1/1/3/21/395